MIPITSTILTNRLHIFKLCICLSFVYVFIFVRLWCLFFFFFFSSRRRHTRFDCDWSSDVCSSDLLQFHGGPGVGKRAGRIRENSPVAAATFLRGSRNACRVFRVHDCFWSSSAWQVDGARVANILELSASSAWTAVHGVFPDAACAYDSNGFDLAGDNRGSRIEPNEFWARNRFSLRREYVGGDGGCVAWRSVPDWSIWTSRHESGSGRIRLCCRGHRGADGEIWNAAIPRLRDRFQRRRRARALQIPLALRCTLSAAVYSTRRQLWDRLRSACT